MSELRNPEHQIEAPEKKVNTPESLQAFEGHKEKAFAELDVSSPRERDTNSASTGEKDSTDPRNSEHSANKERSFADKAKDYVFGAESAYDAERYERSGIKGAFDELPRDRREAVYQAFENAPPEIKSIVNDLSDRLLVEKTKGDEYSHYNPNSKMIRMEPDFCDDEYAEVFCHEYGHFVDDYKGDVSFDREFRDAMSKDLEQYDRNTDAGKQNFDDMLKALAGSDALYDRDVSDNLSAYFKNDMSIVKMYEDCSARYFSHDNVQWAIGGMRESEIYANCFSMSAQDNKASIEFMESFFPNTWEQFEKTL